MFKDGANPLCYVNVMRLCLLIYHSIIQFSGISGLDYIYRSSYYNIPTGSLAPQD